MLVPKLSAGSSAAGAAAAADGGGSVFRISRDCRGGASIDSLSNFSIKWITRGDALPFLLWPIP